MARRDSDGVKPKGVLFTGDSMMRQMFLRLVAFLRGEEVMSEHYYHTDGVYILWDDKDLMTPLTSTSKTKLAPLLCRYFPGYLPLHMQCKKHSDPPLGKDGVVFAMMFQWDAKPSAFRKDFLAMNPRVQVSSFMYWWTKKEPLSAIDGYMAAMDKHHAAGNKKGRRYIYVTTPWTAPGTFGGVDDEIRNPRNKKVSQWILGKGSGVGGGVKAMLLDYSGIAAATKLTKTVDGIHYMCIWTPKFPEPVNSQKDNRRHCSDPMNLAVVQWLLHLLRYSDDRL